MTLCGQPTLGTDSYISSLSKWKQMSTTSTREKLLATRIAFMVAPLPNTGLRIVLRRFS